MDVTQIPHALAQFLSGLSFAEAAAALQPLFLFVIGIVIYTTFIFAFYKRIASRDILKPRRPERMSAARTIVFLFKYLLLFPIAAFGWFLIIAILIFSLSTTTVESAFLVSMAVLATIRITAYLHQELSIEVAKLIPLALLVVFFINISLISAAAPFVVLNAIPRLLETLAYYFLFVVLLELLLQLLVRIIDHQQGSRGDAETGRVAQKGKTRQHQQTSRKERAIKPRSGSD